MSRLSLLDLAFFIAENPASPKHVAGLHIHLRPKGSGTGFARALYEEWLTHTEVKSPFNRVIQFVGGGANFGLMPSWRTVSKVDLTRHLFFHKLKAGSNRREDLYAFVSELHEPMLDRKHPLWEVHVIDGLWDGQFAVYYRMHHAVADGITMARWGAESLSSDPKDLNLRPIWSADHGRSRAGGRTLKLDQQLVAQVWKALTSNSQHAIGVGRLSAMLLLEAVKLTKNAIAVPFMASGETPFTGKATPGRQFATAALPMDRIAAVRKAARATLNHVALTCLDGAMHRYLAEQEIHLDRPITIQMPVSLRRPGSVAAKQSGGNKIGIILVDLAPPSDDAYQRLRDVGYSLRSVRNMVDSVSPQAIETYTILTGVLGQLADLMKLSELVTPMGNCTVSNVPGPEHRLYLKGAPLVEQHPISTLPPTHLLNITLFSYAGQLFVGMVATDTLPELQRLAELVEDEFRVLEATVKP
jgi:diacylglycerol O-acyltransferase / wax synthase